MMSTGTFYGQKVEIKTVFNRFNSETAYGGNLIDNMLVNEREECPWLLF